MKVFSTVLSLRHTLSAVTLFTMTAIMPTTAHAQATLRVALEAKLQIFPPGGINVTANAGLPPVTFQEFIGGGMLSPGSVFGNNVSGGGITTGVVTELLTGNGPDPSSATYNLRFNPSVTLTNMTNSALDVSFVYDLSYGAYVSAMPNEERLLDLPIE